MRPKGIATANIEPPSPFDVRLPDATRATVQANLDPDLFEQLGRPGGALWRTVHFHDERRTPDRIPAVEYERTGT